MDFMQFRQLIEGIKKYFGLQIKTDQQQLTDWFEECKHVLPESIPYIKQQIHDMDGLPRNLPKTIKDCYRVWKNAHEGKIAVELQPCQFCQGSGIMLIKKRDPALNMNYQYATRCGECENWKREFGVGLPMHNSAQLMAQGYEIV